MNTYWKCLIVSNVIASGFLCYMINNLVTVTASFAETTKNAFVINAEAWELQSSFDLKVANILKEKSNDQ